MKYVLLLGALAVGIAVAVVYPPERSRPLWWQWMVIGILTVLLCAVLLPPIGGSFDEAFIAVNREWQRATLSLMSRKEAERLRTAELTVPVLLRCVSPARYDTTRRVWQVRVEDKGRRSREAILLFAEEPSASFLRARSAIVRVQWTGSDSVWIAQRITAIEPWVVLPYIPGLGERARILYFHVPLAWVAVFAYALAMIFALQYLRRPQPWMDIRAMAAVIVGTVFTVLATLTGAIWARFNWGAFWNWDPRQTTIVVLLLIYLAYFALRTSLPEGEQRARLGSVYLVFAFITVPFLIFVLPRMMESLHPGGRGDSTIGPVIDPSPGSLNPLKQLLFSFSLLAFTALFGWLWSCVTRVLQLRDILRWREVADDGVFGAAR